MRTDASVATKVADPGPSVAGHDVDGGAGFVNGSGSDETVPPLHSRRTIAESIGLLRGLCLRRLSHSVYNFRRHPSTKRLPFKKTPK